MAESEQLKELIRFLQQKGFVWGPELEIYNGVAGFYTYGPLGKLLKTHAFCAPSPPASRVHGRDPAHI